MAAIAANTKNYFVGPQDGWVEIVTGASTPVNFLRVSAYPHTHPFQIATGSSAPTSAPTKSTGTFTFATTGPIATQTITIGTEIYTFAASRTVPFTVAVGADFHAAATNFTAAVNSDSTLVKAVDASDVVTLTSIPEGTQANYALATTASNTTRSGALMTGGTDINMGITVCHHPFKVYDATNGISSLFWVKVNNPANQTSAGRLRIDVYSEGGVLQ